MDWIKQLKRGTAMVVLSAGMVFSGGTVLMAEAHPTLAQEPVQVDQMPEKNELIVAYYGRPGVKSLGVLGQHPIEQLKPMIKKKAAEYAKITGKHVRPGFDIIYGLASAAPGPRKDYIIHLNSKKLQPYIDAAENEGFVLFLETQLGEHMPQDAIHHILKYLKHHNVHLAVDPEFEVSNLSVRPGKKIGHVKAAWINQVQEIMDKYMRENGITEKKILLLHMFRHTMVEHKERLKHYDNIDLIFNLDGHGSPKLKVGIYNAIYTEKYADKVAGGFKLFFKEDHPMMTPKQVMGMEHAQGAKVKHPPKLINYQ
ncbi:hypothetical protein [Sulfurovum riftiae]|nr:hypothetical protein [Sulfurovum riftiae]